MRLQRDFWILHGQKLPFLAHFDPKIDHFWPNSGSFFIEVGRPGEKQTENQWKHHGNCSVWCLEGSLRSKDSHNYDITSIPNSFRGEHSPFWWFRYLPPPKWPYFALWGVSSTSQKQVFLTARTWKSRFSASFGTFGTWHTVRNMAILAAVST